MAKRCRSPSTLGRSCRVFRCFGDDEVVISADNLNLLREAGRPFAELLDGGGGCGAPGDMETIFQRFKLSAPMVANLVMAAKGTLDVDESRFQVVAQAAGRLGGFTFIDRQQTEERQRKKGRCPEEDEGQRYEWRSVHSGYAGQIFALTQEGFTFAGFQPACQWYHFRKPRQLS